MADKRRIIVYVLSMIAFIALFLFPVIGFVTTETNASQTESSAEITNDYVFFIVENNDVPLAAVPDESNVSSYILWVGLAAFAVVILFVYSGWYMTTQNNIRELSSKMTPFERSAFLKGAGFFHPVKCHRLAREAEDTVASMYINSYL